MDDEPGVMNKHSIVKNPTRCGREVQWCRARDLEIGDRLLTPHGGGAGHRTCVSV